MKKYLIELNEEKCRKNKSGSYEYIEGKQMEFLLKDSQKKYTKIFMED